ncbi:N-acetyltransferase, partial [Clavibacter michiganensis subsp. insidiosus]
MSVDVTHDPDGSRYTLWLDGERAGFADYLIQGDRIVFTHTEVDPAKRRGGLGGELVRAALDDVRGGSRTVVAA